MLTNNYLKTIIQHQKNIKLAIGRRFYQWPICLFGPCPCKHSGSLLLSILCVLVLCHTVC